MLQETNVREGDFSALYSPLENGSFACVQCGKWFSAENPCCCDYATNEDGSHDDGVCRSCCDHPPVRIWNGKSIAGGTFERCE